MNDAISRQVVIEYLKRIKESSNDSTEFDRGFIFGLEYTQGFIESLMPSAQSERNKGKWIHGLCSVCGYDWGKDVSIANVPPFCPNCGAYMRGEK